MATLFEIKNYECKLRKKKKCFGFLSGFFLPLFDEPWYVVYWLTRHKALVQNLDYLSPTKWKPEKIYHSTPSSQ